MDEEIVQQMGLLLTQVRVTRLSLESIERSTSRFTGLALQASSGGPAFGAPPMVDGALKVYVMNVDDFVAPAGGGFFETMFGSVGRFVGGLVGGVVGGVIGGVQIGSIMNDLHGTVQSLERIVDRLVGELGLTAEQWRTLLGLNESGTGQRVQPAPAGGASSAMLAGLLERMPTDQIVTIVELLTHTVDSLVLLTPIASGVLAVLISSLGDFRLEIVNWISFLMRQLLLLRAVAIAMLADTASLVAPIVATLLSSISRLVAVVMTAATTLLADAIRAAFTTARVLAGGLTAAVNTAIDFVIGTVLPLLNYVQQTPLVKLFAWFMTALPAMMGALAAAAGSPLSSASQTALTTLSASGTTFLNAAPPSTPSTTELDATAILTALDQSQQDTVVEAVEGLGASARAAATATIDQVRVTVTETAAELNRAASRATTTFGPVLDEQLTAARRQIDRLDEVMVAAEEVANRRPERTIDRIAASYRSWLTGGGMQLLLGEITRHFASTPADPDGRTIPGRVLRGFVDADGRHDVIVEVGEVVIDVTDRPPDADRSRPGRTDASMSQVGLEERARARGGRPDDLLPVGVQ